MSSIELETHVAVLQSDMNRLAVVFGKLETTMEKLGDVSNSIAKIIAVHEEKLSKRDQTENELFVLIEQRKAEFLSDIRELNSRISTVHQDLSTDITETENSLKTALREALSEIKLMIAEQHDVNDTQRQDLEKRIRDLEKWRWIIFGGSVVVGAFIRDIVTFATK